MWFLEHSRETRGTCREAFAFHVARDSLLCRRWLFLPDLNSMRPWWLICALCVSQCVTGALVADWPQCAYVSLHVVLYVSALKKKKKKGLVGWKRLVWGKETNYMSTKWGGGSLPCDLSTNANLDTHTHTHTHTHTRTQTNLLEEKWPARRSGGKHVVSILEGRTHPALCFLHLPPLHCLSLSLSRP